MISLMPSAQLALDTIHQRPVGGIPGWLSNIMEHAHLERLAGVSPGDYRTSPEAVYLAAQYALGTCLIDQYIWDNPLSMGHTGYQGAAYGATTGAAQVVCDGMLIDSPEAVVAHLEQVVFPQLQASAKGFDVARRVREILDGEVDAQRRIGPTILKSGYGFISFPGLPYHTYGYEQYFMAFALYPEVMERHFALQAELAVCQNRAAACAYREGQLPPLFRLDHDMADSRGTLVNITALDKLWFPHFARALEPMLNTGVKLIWHCDGNLMAMVPRLLEVGLHGFQGFQYEDGMDYPRICAMKTRAGDDLLIIAGVSVTRTLPMGTPAEVKREMRWLVDNGPKTGLFLGASSSITPGVPWENIAMYAEGLRYYQTHGREGEE